VYNLLFGDVVPYDVIGRECVAFHWVNGLSPESNAFEMSSPMAFPFLGGLNQ
jgi:hypothetical protein